MASDSTTYFQEPLPERVTSRPTGPLCQGAEETRATELTSLGTPSAEDNDQALIEQVAGNSRAALGILFRRYRSAVLSVAHRILKDTSEAEDLCQEVFLMIFQKAKLFDPSKGTASSWIIQIAYHRAINRRHYLASRQHYTATEFDEQQISGDRQPALIDAITARILLYQLREQLTVEQLETLELHFFEGYTLREIAERTGQTVGNVRHHYYRGLERLRSNVFPKKGA